MTAFVICVGSSLLSINTDVTVINGESIRLTVANREQLTKSANSHYKCKMCTKLLLNECLIPQGITLCPRH